ICVDDLERIGTGIDIRNVLGLASQLKELKACKVALILNDEALDDEKNEEFRRYFEKVIDTHLKFSPTPKECTHIAVDVNSELGRSIAESCNKLGVDNIRVI